MKFLTTSDCAEFALGRKMSQHHFAKNLNKATTTLSKEEDDDESDEDDVGDTGGRSNDITSTVVELMQEKKKMLKMKLKMLIIKNLAMRI